MTMARIKAELGNRCVQANHYSSRHGSFAGLPGSTYAEHAPFSVREGQALPPLAAVLT